MDTIVHSQSSEDKLAGAKRQGQAQFESILEMVQELTRAQKAMDDSEIKSGPMGHLWKPIEAARQRIHEDALSVEVRSDWHTPGDRLGTAAPTEYRILLCTGGPACQIVGQLNEHCEPETAVMQVQDWFQPWTDFRPVFAGAGEPAGEDLDGEGLDTAEAVMLAYARCFWFGE